MTQLARQLAIKGHETRGKEVIDILEMLGGENEHKLNGCNIECVYYEKNRVIYNTSPFSVDFNNTILFTLEEFLEKYPFKVGDMVSVPEYESEVCIDDMKWNGFEIQYSVYSDEIDDLFEWYSVGELNKCDEPYKEEIMEEKRKYDELRMPLDDDDKLSTEVTIDGNKIFPQRII